MPRLRDSNGRFVSASGEKAATTVQWVSSTVRTGERTRSYSATDTESAQFISQCFGFAQICAMRIAEDSSMVPIRLYRPKKRRASDGRAVSKSVKRYLCDGSAGMKAASKFRSDDDLEEVVDHPILTILNRPNPYQSGIQFRQSHTMFRKLAGSSYIMPDRKLGFLHLLYPQWVKVIGGKDNLVDQFLYGRSENTTRFAADEVWWSKNMPSPFSPFKGLAPLAAVMTEQQLYAVINQAELAIFDNCGRPDAIVAFEGSLGDSSAKAILADLETRHRGAQNAGRMAIATNTKMTVTPLGWAPKDLGNVELQKHVIQNILAAFKVPESEVYMNDANVASARTGNVQYIRQTVMPCAIQDAEELTTWLVEEEFGLDGWCLAPENAVAKDEDAESTRLLAQVAAGVVTANEARRQLGYDEVEEEIGGVLRVNGQAIAILDEVARRPPPDPFGGFNAGGNGAGVGGDDREDDGSGGDSVQPKSGDADNERAGDGMESEDSKRLPAPEPEPAAEPHSSACGASCTHGKSVKQSELWSKAIDPTDGPETAVNDTATMRLYRKVEAALLARRDQIISASNEAPHGLDKKMVGLRGTKDATDDLVRRILSAWGVVDQAEQFAQKLEAMTDQEIRELFDSGVRVGLGQIAKLDETGVLPTLSNDRALAFYSDFKAEYVKRLAAVDETTAASVERAIRDGMADGESLRAIQGRIMSAFEGDGEQTITQARAAMIARTETANATVQGQMGGYAEAGVEEYEFSLAPNPCEFCEAVSKQYSGVGVKIGTPLYKQGDTLTGADGGTMVMDYGDTYVPIHPNCRCEIRPRVKR